MEMLGQMSWGQWFLAALIIGVSGLLILVILIQRGRGGGLAGAFGGAGGTSAFGAKTGDVFTWITVVVATVFVLLAVVANYALDQSAQRRRGAPAATTGVPSAPEQAPEGAVPPPAATQPVTTVPVELPKPAVPQPPAAEPADKDAAEPQEDVVTPPAEGAPHATNDEHQEQPAP